MKSELKRETLNTRIKPSLLNAVRKGAEHMGVSQSFLIESALVTFLSRAGILDEKEYYEE